MRSPEEVHRNFPGGPVLVVGDSHTWMAGAGRQYPEWDTDCRAGRTTTEGLSVVAENLDPRHRVVVFDNATNDGLVPAEQHWGELLALRRLVEDRQLVLVSSWRLDISLEHVVANQRRLASQDPEATSVADWADFVSSHRQYFAHDDLHFTDAAMPIRTGIVWAAVRAAELRDAAARARRVRGRG
jgi:hypothetical protein